MASTMNVNETLRGPGTNTVACHSSQKIQTQEIPKLIAWCFLCGQNY